jgi:hypothetical protein
VTRRLSPTRKPNPTPAPRLALVAAAALLAVAPARGSTLLNFSLTNEGSTPISKVDFKVLPPGAVVPPVVGTDPDSGKDLTGSPLTILPTTRGVDTSHFSVALGSGPGVQGVRLLFGQTQTVGADGKVAYTQATDASGQPVGLFMPGSVLNFALNVDSNDPSSVRLELPEGATGLTLKEFASGTGGGTGTDSGGTTVPGGPVPNPGIPMTQVPEPGSLALWSALAALALARVRTFRRARAARA